MPNGARGTQMLLSANELRTMTNWPNPVILEFLSLQSGIQFDGVFVRAKKLTGTTGPAAGDTVTIAHRVNGERIDGIQVMVLAGGVLYPPSTPDPATEFTFTADATGINITNGASATTILGQPLKIVLLYEP